MTNDNVRSIMEEISKRSAMETIELVMTDDFLTFMLDESEKRFSTIEEQRAAIIGSAIAVGYFGLAIRRGNNA